MAESWVHRLFSERIRVANGGLFGPDKFVLRAAVLLAVGPGSLAAVATLGQSVRPPRAC